MADRKSEEEINTAPKTSQEGVGPSTTNSERADGGGKELAYREKMKKLLDDRLREMSTTMHDTIGTE